MIILDTSVLRACGLDSSSADLLRTIRTVGAERVAAPWMVMEELVAQKAVKYRQKYDAAVAAVRAYESLTPWDRSIPMGICDLTRLRSYWRARYSTLVEELPTSEHALREAAFREANALAPCRATESSHALKTGGRDAAIWLSAIEYARKHPDETVYFVCANTRDFGDGSSYASPMDQDVKGFGTRFVHLTDVDELISRFTQPVEANEAGAAEVLNTTAARDAVGKVAKARLGGMQSPFECTSSAASFDRRPRAVAASSWHEVDATFGELLDVRAYRIGEHEWCTATVRWILTGSIFWDGYHPPAASAWTTSVLFTPDPENSRLAVLRWAPPRALTDKELTRLGVTDTMRIPTQGHPVPAEATTHLGDSLRHEAAARPRGLPGPGDRLRRSDPEQD